MAAAATVSVLWAAWVADQEALVISRVHGGVVPAAAVATASVRDNYSFPYYRLRLLSSLLSMRHLVKDNPSCHLPA